MYWNVTWSSIGRENLFPRREDRVAIARTITRIESAEVLLFSAVDDHLHLVVKGEDLGHLGGALRRNLARRHPVHPAHFKAVAGRRHLLSLVEYLLRQPDKHDLSVPAALWEGSCFPDLVGARAMGFDTGPLLRAIPRLHQRDFLNPVGLRATPEPLPWEEVESLGTAHLARAVASAAGLDSLQGARTAERVAARRALAWLAHRVGLPSSSVAAALALSPRSAHRLREDEEPPLVGTTRVRLHLEQLAPRMRS